MPIPECRIVIVDDEPHTVSALADLAEAMHSLDVEVRHPEDVDLELLFDAQLVLVDYGLSKWQQSSSVPVMLRFPDGLALAAALQRQLVARRHERGTANGGLTPTAFAVITADPTQLARPLPPIHRRHVLAQSLNLEWVFSKDHERLVDQIASLAAAVKKLPQTWSVESQQRRERLARLLALEPDETDALIDAERAIPPIHELTQWSHGVALLRWLLHRVFPYPAFLWGHLYMAARLGVAVDWISRNLALGSPLRTVFANCEYRGVLHGFVEVRWWRERVEQLLWRETNGQSFEPAAVLEWLCNATGDDVEPCPIRTPVVGLNDELVPDSLVEMTEAVKIQPDDWPSYAAPAWVPRSLLAEETRLNSFVVHHEGE